MAGEEEGRRRRRLPRRPSAHRALCSDNHRWIGFLFCVLISFDLVVVVLLLLSAAALHPALRQQQGGGAQASRQPNPMRGVVGVLCCYEYYCDEEECSSP